MNINITVRGIDEKEAEKSSNSVKNYAENALKKLSSFLEKEQQPVYIDVVITVVHPHPNHSVEVRVREPRYHFVAERSGPELYKVIDEVMEIAHSEAMKHKNKFVDERRREGHEEKVKSRSIK